jgi:hypothetical protein
MEMQNNIAANAQPIAPEIWLDRKALASAAKLIASIVERRNTVPVLSCILIASNGETATLTATDLDVMATYRLPTLARALPFRAAVPAAELARLVAKLDKGRDDVSLTIERRENWRGEGPAIVTIACGRARFKLATSTDEFPTLVDAGEVERDAWQCTADEAAAIDPRIDGLAAPEKVGKLFAKARKLIGDASVEMATWARDDSPRMEMTAGPLAMRFKLGEAAQMLPEPKASKFRYNNAPSDDAAITAYLIGLATRYGLDMSAARHAVTYSRDGLAMGMAFGKSEYIRGELIEIVDYETLTVRHEMTEGREIWADGSYCVVMPRADQAAVTVQRLDDSGEWSAPEPVRTDSAGRLEWDAIGSLPDLFGPIEAAPPAVEKVADVPAESQAPPAIEAAEPVQIVEEYSAPIPADMGNPITTDPLEALAARVAALEAILARGNDEAPAMEENDRQPAETLPPYPSTRQLAGAFSFSPSNAVENRDMRAKRLRIVRRYLAMRKERAGARDTLRMMIDSQTESIAAHAKAHDEWLSAAGERWAHARAADKRAEDAEFRLSELTGRVEKAEARAIAAEAIAAPALDKAQARIVALEREVARLRPPVTMSGAAVHAMLYGARRNVVALERRA